jgi:hypothetical protein
MTEVYVVGSFISVSAQLLEGNILKATKIIKKIKVIYFITDW